MCGKGRLVPCEWYLNDGNTRHDRLCQAIKSTVCLYCVIRVFEPRKRLHTKNIPTASCLSTRTCGAQSTTKPLPLSSMRFLRSASTLPFADAVAKMNGIGSVSSSTDWMIEVISSGRSSGQKPVPRLAHRLVRCLVLDLREGTIPYVCRELVPYSLGALSRNDMMRCSSS